MHIAEYTFHDIATPQMREEVTNVATESETLDTIINEWVLKRSARLSLGVALDDDGKHLPNMIAIAFDDPEGNEVCCATFERSLFEAKYDGIRAYDTYLAKGWTNWREREIDQTAWDSWLRSIGMSESFALMARIGPRSAALPYTIAFILNVGGIVEIRGVEDNEFDDEDMLPDLIGEGLTMSEFIQVQAALCDPKRIERGAVWIMDPVYFKRDAEYTCCRDS